MSGSNEETDPASSIHLNEDDWLKLLQKLTPSSIDNLQQTLKRIQTEASPTPERSNIVISTVAQSCASSLISDTHMTPTSTPIVVSVGTARTAVSPVVCVPPPVVNLTKPISTQMHNTIVLPSSALLIAPSTRPQSIGLDSYGQLSNMGRLLVNSSGLLTGSTGPIMSATNHTTEMDHYNSLNTLANAAMAAANATNSTHWLSDTSKATTKPLMTLSIDPNRRLSPAKTITPVSTPSSSRPTDTQFRPILSNHVDLSHFLPTAGLTVLPLQVSANGQTVFLTSTPPSSINANTTFGANTTMVVSTNTIPTTSFRSLDSPILIGTSCSSSTSSTPTTTVVSGSCSTPLSPTPSLSGLISPAPIMTSTPRSKPKFKALWDPTTTTTEQQQHLEQPMLIDSDDTTPTPTDHIPVLFRMTTTTTTATTPATQTPGNGTSIVINTRHNSPLSATKTIGQTPKRLAATLATSLASENNGNQDGNPSNCSSSSYSSSFSPSSLTTATSTVMDGSKRLLLVCSQAKLPSVTMDSGLSTTASVNLFNSNNNNNSCHGNTTSLLESSILTKALQPRMIPLTTASINSSGIGGGGSGCVELMQIEPHPTPLKSMPPLLAPAQPLVLSGLNNISGGNMCSSGGGITTNTANSTTAVIPVASEVDKGTTIQFGTRMPTMFNRAFERQVEGVCEDEARRRAKRRERNRVAAARCRQRRQDQIVDLQHRVGMLIKTGEDLRSSLQHLDVERTRLEGLIRQHGLNGCPEAEAVLYNPTAFFERPETRLITESSLESTLVNLDELAQSSARPPISSSSLILLSHPTSSSSASFSFNPTLTTTITKVEAPDSGGTTATATTTTRSSSGYLPPMAKLDLRQFQCTPNLLVSIPGLSNGADPTAAATATAAAITAAGGGGGFFKVDESASMVTQSLIDSQKSTITTTSAPGISAKLSTRPSTLLPPKLITDLAQLVNLASNASSSSSNANFTTNSVFPGLVVTSTQSGVTAATAAAGSPCFWPSELHTFSPILTPSTWKLLKNISTGNATLSSSTTTTTTTPQPQPSFFLTPNASNPFGAPTLSIGTIGTSPSGAMSLLAALSTASTAAVTAATTSVTQTQAGTLEGDNQQQQDEAIDETGRAESSQMEDNCSKSLVSRADGVSGGQTVVITFGACDRQTKLEDLDGGGADATV